IGLSTSSSVPFLLGIAAAAQRRFRPFLIFFQEKTTFLVDFICNPENEVYISKRCPKRLLFW
ncbi:MAG: hypothetical protein IJJ26_11620, partial [Victivallales bacterium]|nr:hypothetical protein [Victivallales bacterium]